MSHHAHSLGGALIITMDWFYNKRGNKIYRRKCDFCGKYYKGQGKYYCSKSCSGKVWGFQKGIIPPTAWKKGHIPWDKNKKRPGFLPKSAFKVGHKKPKNAHKFPKGGKEPWQHCSPSLKTRKKMSEASKGEKCYLWKGGITPELKLLRSGIEFRTWRERVFAKDKWVCMRCKRKRKKGDRTILHPHHILNFSTYSELRCLDSNGITLCKECHELFHKIYGKNNNTKEQLNKFLKSYDKQKSIG